MKPFSPNSDSIARSQVIEIGENKEHRILLIDDFFEDPDAVREAALDPSRNWAAPTSVYPGLLAYPEPECLTKLAPFFSNLLKRQLRQSDQIFFSTVTKTEDELTPLQRRPHFDGSCFGGLVYLNPPDQCKGGTGFYRHRATGLCRYPEKISDVPRDLISRLGLNSLEELQKLVSAPPAADSAGYITESNAEWERFCLVEMKFNRFIIYDGQIFHSSVIRSSDFGTSPDERRLTLNFFADRE